MATMDSSIVNVALPTIVTGLPASGAQVQLVSAGYLVASAAFLVTGARLGDSFGHARMFRIGLTAFTAASLGCGLAPNAVALIAARTVQGAAGVLMVPQVISLIQLRFQGRARVRAVSLYSMVLALGVATGQILGGVIVTIDLLGLSWRPALLVNIPVGVLLLVAAHRVLPPDRPGTVTRLDLVGAAILAVAVSAVVVPLVYGRELGWPVWCAALLAAGLAGLVVFTGYQRRLVWTGRQPLLDLRALHPPAVGVGLLACVLVMGAYTAFVFTLTLHLQSGLGFSALRAGLTLVPFAVGFAAVSLSWTRLPECADRVLPIAGPLVFVGGVTAVVVVSRHGWPAPAAAVLLLCAGGGHAAGFSPLFARIGALVGARHASALSALGNTGALMAGAASVAGLAGLYLAVAEHRPTRSHLGLSRVAVAIDAVLLVTAGCAAWTVSRRPAAPEP
jgi:MFS family permease